MILKTNYLIILLLKNISQKINHSKNISKYRYISQCVKTGFNTLATWLLTLNFPAHQTQQLSCCSYFGI